MNLLDWILKSIFNNHLKSFKQFCQFFWRYFWDSLHSIRLTRIVENAAISYIEKAWGIFTKSIEILSIFKVSDNFFNSEERPWFVLRKVSVSFPSVGVMAMLETKNFWFYYIRRFGRKSLITAMAPSKENL